MKVKILFLFLSAVFLSAARAHACSCIRQQPPCASYKETGAVFVALVTAVDEPDKNPDAPPYAHLTVERAFKGIGETKIKMWQGTGGGDCSFVFEKGERYLIYADYDAETRQFHTNTCTRSSRLAHASDDLDYLLGLPASDKGTRLSGSVVRYDYEDGVTSPPPEGVGGAKVIAEGAGGRRFEAVTNAEGFYKMVDLPPGRYKVRAEVPAHLRLAKDKPETIEVPRTGCAAADFLARTDGRIAGLLLDAEGRPAPQTDVDLVPFELADKVGDRRIGRYRTTDKDGRFEFTDLRPGRYLLGVNIRSEPDGDIPYRRTYFPGVPAAAGATVIELGRGEKLGGYELRLPPRLPLRTVTGVFLWPDGRPVTKALLMFKDTADIAAGRTLGFADVDGRGRFSYKLLEGTEAWVHGSVFVSVEQGLDALVAEPVRVVADSGLRPVRLVVTKKAGGGVRIVP